MKPKTDVVKQTGKSSCATRLLAPLFGGLALLYLFNPTAGILELLPDNLPGVGNLDEGAAVLLLTNVLAWYGFDPGRGGSKLAMQRRAGSRKLLTRLLAPVLGGLALLYLLNPTAGILEMLPDNLPGVGNLDEGAAVLLLRNVLAWYGVDLNRWGRHLRG